MSPVPRLTAVPTLSEVAQNRTLLDGLPAEVLVELRRQAGHLREDLEAAVALGAARPRGELHTVEADRWVGPAEAARMFGVKKRWLLEHADDIPGCRRLSKKVIRFSERALARYLARKTA